jgi:hypothetical protein
LNHSSTHAFIHA